MLYLLPFFLISAKALNSFTDPSLLFKLTGDSEVIDGNFVILPSSSKQIRSGGLISNEVIELESFEMQIKLAFDKTSFSSFWFSSSGQVPGPVYGLSRDFKGFGIFCDSKQGKLHLAELSSIQDPLNLSQFPFCQVDLQMVKSVHIHVRNQTFEVWLDQGKMIRCGEIKIKRFNSVYFGIASSGQSLSLNISQISIIPNEDERILSMNSSELSNVIHKKLLFAEAKLISLETLFKDLFASPQIHEVDNKIHELVSRLQNMLLLTPKLHKILQSMHIDDKFTKFANKEIVEVAQQLKTIHTRFESLMNFVDNKEILAPAYQSVEGRYSEMTSHGGKLKKELKQAEKNFKLFEKHYEDDKRMIILHVILAIFSFLVLVLCCKVTCVDESNE